MNPEKLLTRLLVAGAIWALLLFGQIARAAKPTKDGLDFFEKNIRPVLADSCYKCHSAKANEKKKLEANLYLDSWAGIARGGQSGDPAIVPGDPGKSLLIKAIRYKFTGDDEDRNMPPKSNEGGGKLPDETIRHFESWVEMGAPYPQENAAGPAAATAKSHWAFQAPKSPAIPKVIEAARVQDPVDAFVIAALEKSGLTLNRPADKRTLLRRATFDLTGLPPTAAEVDEFMHDHSHGAFSKVVDRLLASPRYGERWGRHWLDVARYSDTKGYVFQEDRQYPFAYTYRDWVINAFNTDLPFDQFLIQQIAADKLDVGKDNSPLAALGFLTLGRRFLNSVPDIIDDRLDVIGRGTMGLTIGCARCHDHKFDPIPTSDYYSLYGVLDSSVEPKEMPLLKPAAWVVSTPKAPARAMAIADAPSPHDSHVHLRGNAGNPGPVVPRHFLTVLSRGKPQPLTEGSGRLQLARAIANRDNPLTARVWVNRVWLYHFGKAIVRTPSDFGTRSDPPTHPELLDWLAVRFMSDGWSVKKLHRLILLSAAYQQASVDNAAAENVDPENLLLWRMNRQRLDFESTRDSLLAVVGELDEARGGPAGNLADAGYRRRTIYGSIDRQNLPSVFRTFDFASPDATSPQRFMTTTPQQALYFMNSPFVMSRAKALAARPDIKKFADSKARIARLYRTLFAREATPEEIAAGLKYLDAEGALTAVKKASNLSPWEKYAQVLLESNEFVFID
jgi:cytochrome c553